jgi:hypothetical protein
MKWDFAKSGAAPFSINMPEFARPEKFNLPPAQHRTNNSPRPPSIKSPL